jgi:DNA-binding HxlR family transcriptional regulator
MDHPSHNPGPRTLVASSGLPADVYSARCPTRDVLDHLASKWTILIIDTLGAGTHRFAELRRTIDGISEKMLAQTLRRLEQDGLLTRTVYPEVPPHTEYALTPLGHSISAPIASLRSWAEENINEVIAARSAYESKTDHQQG